MPSFECQTLQRRALRSVGVADSLPWLSVSNKTSKWTPSLTSPPPSPHFLVPHVELSWRQRALIQSCLLCALLRLQIGPRAPTPILSFIPHPSCESRSFCPAAASAPDMWHVQPSEDPALTVAVAPCVKVMTCIYNIRSPNHSQGLWREQPPLWFLSNIHTH